MKSLGAKVKQIGAMADTKDLDAKANAFVKKMVDVTRNGEDTRMLTPGQVKFVEDLHERHFGDG